MDSFFEQLINGVYQEAQRLLILLFNYPPYRCTIVKFGGFHFSHNWYGKTDLVYDKIGDLKVFTKTIYLNYLFLAKQFNIINNSEYNLAKLANTIAHELAHCLRADFEPSEANRHDFAHAFMTYCIEYYLLETYEFWLLEQLAKRQKKPFSSLALLKKHDH